MDCLINNLEQGCSNAKRKPGADMRRIGRIKSEQGCTVFDCRNNSSVIVLSEGQAHDFAHFFNGILRNIACGLTAFVDDAIHARQVIQIVFHTQLNWF